MATVSLKELYEKFKSLDLPDNADFRDLIDSCYNYSMSAIILSGGDI